MRVEQSNLYNNHSETRNLIGQYPCRIKQPCTENAIQMPSRGLYKISDNENILTCDRILNERHVNKNVNIKVIIKLTVW